MEIIHATSVDIKGAGILILGQSSSGKSDLALRLIENKNAVLIADDQTILKAEGKNLIAFCPKNIKGLLEVRGIGIIKTTFKPKTVIKLVVISETKDSIERFPSEVFYETQGIHIPMIRLNLIEPSAPDKVVVKLKTILEEKKQKQ